MDISPQLTLLGVSRYPSLVAGNEGGSYRTKGGYEGKKGDQIIEPVFFSPFKFKKLRGGFFLMYFAFGAAGTRDGIYGLVFGQLTSSFSRHVPDCRRMCWRLEAIARYCSAHPLGQEINARQSAIAEPRLRGARFPRAGAERRRFDQGRDPGAVNN
jgi:hypothetical protein